MEREMEHRFDFHGKGDVLFGKFFLGVLLCCITCGIYYPWFIVNLTKFIHENTTFKAGKDDIQFEFVGTGGKLFGTFLGGVLLTIITFGIYAPWFTVKLTGYFTENLVAKSKDGTNYSLHFIGTGGQLLGIFLGNFLLTLFTFGIYMPWAACKLTAYFAKNTEITKGGNVVGSFAFTGSGGELFGTYLLGIILTCITFGIYAAWFSVKLFKFTYENTTVTFNGKEYVGGFTGTGKEYFVIYLVGFLLTAITFGIYGAWFVCKQLTFQFKNTVLLNKT